MTRRFVIYPEAMVTRHIIKNRPPKTHHHLLRFAELERAANPSRNEALFLSVSFSDSASSNIPKRRKSIRKGRLKSGVPGPGWEYYEMVEVQYHPEADRVMPPEGTPWASHDDPTVLFAKILPLPRLVTSRFPGLRRFVANLLDARISKLRSARGPQRRWLLHLGLLPESATIEVGTTTWTALRRNPEVVERIEIP